MIDQSIITPQLLFYSFNASPSWPPFNISNSSQILLFEISRRSYPIWCNFQKLLIANLKKKKYIFF